MSSLTPQDDSDIDNATMSAWQIHSYEGVSQMQCDSLTRPKVTRPDDVLVQVMAASVNPLDPMMTEGYGQNVLRTRRRMEGGQGKGNENGREFPLTLGRDFSGVVAAVGARVNDLAVGDAVWGVTSPWEGGTHQEYLVVSRKVISRKPANLSHVESAAIPYAAMTAWSVITKFGGVNKKSKNQRVLVLGGSGGVGHLAIQILKAWGCEVVVTCSPSSNEMVSKCGPDKIINYTDEDFHDQLGKVGKFDLIYDCAGQSDQAIFNHLKSWSCARYVGMDGPLLTNTDNKGLVLGSACVGMSLVAKNMASLLTQGSTYVWGFFQFIPGVLEELAEMVENQQLFPIVESVFRFTELPESYEKVQNGRARGKTVVKFNASEGR